MSRKNLNLGVAVLSLVLLCGVGACSKHEAATSGPVTVVSGEAKIGGAFTLTDQTGKIVTNQDFLGRPQLIYFGYSSCPDVCPTSLQQMAVALDNAGLSNKDIWPIFITVDPAHDTPQVLSAYVTASAFPPGLIGLTGSEDQINKVKDVFKVYAARVKDTKSTAGYSYDHSSMIYFMDKNGKFLDVFSALDTPKKISERLKRYKKTGH